MSSSEPSTRTCGYPKCGRKTNRRSNLCTTHRMQAWRHGAAGKAGVREPDYKPFNNWCADGLARYRNTAATAAALQIANTLLNYTATHEYTYQTELARMMGLLRMTTSTLQTSCSGSVCTRRLSRRTRSGFLVAQRSKAGPSALCDAFVPAEEVWSAMGTEVTAGAGRHHYGGWPVLVRDTLGRQAQAGRC